MNIWRLQTLTGGNDIAKRCLDKSMIIMGWSFSEKNTLWARAKLKKNCNFDNFCKLADECYGSRSKYSSVCRMVEETEPNDIVWMRYDGKYYYGRITEKSKWFFDFSDEACESDTSNCYTDVQWHLVDDYSDESSVPGCLTTGFIKGSTFQRIKKEGIIEYSQMLYNMEYGKKEGFMYPDPDLSLNEKSFWNMLQPSDAEDLLCMYLFKTKGYIVIPSTNKKSTQLYECVMLNPDSDKGEHIYIQVKKGNVDINADEYRSLNGKVYLLTTGGKVYNAADKRHHVVNPSEIYEFALDSSNKSLITDNIARWIKFLANADNSKMSENIKKGIMFDTNRAYSDSDELEMLSRNRISAFGGADRYVRSFRKGDYVLYYSKGLGVIAIGEIISEKPKRLEDDSGLYADVKMIVPENEDYTKVNKISISAKEIVELLNRNFYFASTIKSPFLTENQVKILIKALKEKYLKYVPQIRI